MDRRALLLGLLFALFLGSLAGTLIVPDPTWIAGVYDGGDGDEVAILLEHTPGIVPALSLPLTSAARPLATPPARPAVVSRPLPRTTSRAPPHA